MNLFQRLMKVMTAIERPTPPEAIKTQSSITVGNEQHYPVCNHLGGLLYLAVDNRTTSSILHWISASGGHEFALLFLAQGENLTMSHLQDAKRVLDHKLMTSQMATSARNAVNKAFGA